MNEPIPVQLSYTGLDNQSFPHFTSVVFAISNFSENYIYFEEGNNDLRHDRANFFQTEFQAYSLKSISLSGNFFQMLFGEMRFLQLAKEGRTTKGGFQTSNHAPQPRYTFLWSMLDVNAEQKNLNLSGIEPARRPWVGPQPVSWKKCLYKGLNWGLSSLYNTTRTRRDIFSGITH